MISNLIAKRPRAIKDFTETKQGAFVFTGTPSEFHEWEFRTMAKFLGITSDDKPALAAKIIDGLRDQALSVAMELGAQKLAEEDVVEVLIARMSQAVFPYKDAEAKELYRLGHEKDGILSRQLGEDMVQSVSYTHLTLPTKRIV